jgi:hypothetical protein
MGGEVGPPPKQIQRRVQAARLNRRGRGGVRPPNVPQWCNGDLASLDLLCTRRLTRKGSETTLWAAVVTTLEE